MPSLIVPDMTALQAWIGRGETTVDHVTVPAVQRLSALLDRDDPLPQIGDPLPVGWYSILFPRVVRRSLIGTDGHPALGDFLPPVPLPRRMFAGRRTTFAAPLRVGDVVEKHAVIHSVTSKTGRSGQMIFVTVRSEIHSPRGLAIVEEQDIVYREAVSGEAASRSPAAPAPAAATAPAEPLASPGGSVWRSDFTADEVTIFRYSALTYNGHRIHYDHPYVTGTEGYPALVVNGGLATLMLYELARAHSPAPIVSLASRNLRPMFAHRPLVLEGAPSADGRSALLRVLDDTGSVTVQAEAVLGAAR
jgi:3-methylfumaryl-CoA hydratase